MDSADAIKKIAAELKEKFDECGMGAVDAFGDKLDEIKDKASKGPGDIADKLQAAMNELAKRMEEVRKDPSSLAPSGRMAACADWYGSSVACKLSAFGEETNSMMEAVTKLGTDISGPLKNVGKVLEAVTKELETSLKRLSKLPAEVTKLGDTCKEPADVANIDTKGMMKATDTSSIEVSLTKVVGLKDVLGPAVKVAKEVIQKLADFISQAPDMIRMAFDVPPPLCFMTSMLLSQAPPAMTSLMDMIEKLKVIDLQPVLTMIEDAAKTIMNLDVAKVKSPVESFGTIAKEKVESLDQVVQAAKMAGGAAGMMGNVGKLF